MLQWYHIFSLTETLCLISETYKYITRVKWNNSTSKDALQKRSHLLEILKANEATNIQSRKVIKDCGLLVGTNGTQSSVIISVNLSLRPQVPSAECCIRERYFSPGTLICHAVWLKTKPISMAVLSERLHRTVFGNYIMSRSCKLCEREKSNSWEVCSVYLPIYVFIS